MTTHYQTKLRGTAAILLTLTLGLAGCAENAIDTLDSHITASNALSPRDELEIHQLLARMNLAIDTQSWDAYVTFYAEDGVLDSGIAGVSQGHDEIRAWLEAMAPYISTKRHVVSNIIINGAGNQATSVAYLTVFERESALRLDGTAVVTDELERGPDGRWVVVRHTTTLDPATLAASQGGAE